jgi:hypothetical protein
VPSPSRLKTGADGFFVAILPTRGLGVALKVADGATRASNCTIATLLVRLGVLDADHPATRRFMNAAHRESSRDGGGPHRPGQRAALDRAPRQEAALAQGDEFRAPSRRFGASPCAGFRALSWHPFRTADFRIGETVNLALFRAF